MDLLIVVFIPSCMSALACIWLLYHLSRVDLSQRRLFWRQLLAFVVTYEIWAIIAIIAFAFGGAMTKFRCMLFLSIRTFLEISICFLEVQIAAGLAAACHRWVRCGIALRWAIPFAFLLGLLTMPVSIQFDRVTYSAEKSLCYHSREPVWDGVVVSCGLAALALYGSSVVATRDAPRLVVKRTLLSGLCYLLAFELSFGFRAVPALFSGLFNDPDGNSWMLQALIFLWCLNGALNAGLYAFFMWGARGATTGNTSFRVDFRSRTGEQAYTVSRTRSLEISTTESESISRYFDLVGPNVVMPSESPLRN